MSLPHSKTGSRRGVCAAQSDGFAQHERQASIEVAVLFAMVLATMLSVGVSLWKLRGDGAPAAPQVSDAAPQSPRAMLRGGA